MDIDVRCVDIRLLIRLRQAKEKEKEKNDEVIINFD